MLAAAPRLLRTALPRLARATSTLAPGSSRDPGHPHLHYHAQPAAQPSRITLSLLPTPSSAHSRCVLGYLPPVADAGLNDFVENPHFREVLHKAIKDGLAKGVSETVEFEAGTRPGDGFMHITGGSTLPLTWARAHTTQTSARSPPPGGSARRKTSSGACTSRTAR